MCCQRDCVSWHNGGTPGAPLKPLRDDSASGTYRTPCIYQNNALDCKANPMNERAYQDKKFQMLEMFEKIKPGHFLVDDMQTPLPPHLKIGQIRLRDAQCSETYGKIILPFSLFNKWSIFCTQNSWHLKS